MTATTTRCAACDWYTADPSSDRGWCKGCEAFGSVCPRCDKDALVWKLTDDFDHIYDPAGDPLLVCPSCGHEEAGR